MRRKSTFIDLALALTLTACGGAPPAPPPPPKAFDPSPFLPERPDVLLRVDLEQLRQSAHWPWFANWSRIVTERLREQAGILGDPRVPQVMEASDVLWLSMTMPPGATALDFTMVARGRRRVLEDREEALIGGGLATQVDARTVVLQSQRARSALRARRPLPFRATAAVEVMAEPRLLRARLGDEDVRWPIVSRAQAVRAELLSAPHGLSITVVVEPAEGTRADQLRNTGADWLLHLRDHNVMRFLGLHVALLQTRVELLDDSCTFVLTLESPRAEQVLGAVDAGMKAMDDTSGIDAMESHLTSHTRPGERLWDEESCASLGWHYAWLSRQQSVLAGSQDSGDADRATALSMRMQRARSLLDSKCSFRTF